MARTSASKVEAILDTSLTGTDLDPFIETATAMVDEYLKGEGVSDTMLELVERWLSAHFAAMWDQRVAKESVGRSSWQYEGQTGMALLATRYGQQALTLDPTGRLSEVSQEGRKKVKFKVGNDIDYL